MATAEEILQPDVEAQATRRPHIRLRLLAGFVLGFGVILGLAGGALYAWDAGYEGRILPGVEAVGVDLSGLDRAQATAALTEALGGLGAGRVVIHTDAGDVSVAYFNFGRRADVSALVDEAMRAGRAGSPVERAIGEIRQAIDRRSLEPRIALDEAALSAGVSEALSWLNRAPVDATIARGARRIYTTPAREGRTYDAAAVAAAALEAVRRLDAPREVVVQAAAVSIPPARTDEDVEAARQAARRMMSEVRVEFGNKHWTFKASVVQSWITFAYAEDGSVRPVADEGRIATALSRVAKGVWQDAVSAAFLGAKHGRIVGVVPARNGRRLDTTATAAAIAHALAARASWITTPPVQAAVAVVPPKLSTEEAVKSAPLMSRLGSWKTWFPVSERNYFGANIWLPAKIIDGTVLQPGQRFEWWSAIGPITSARGFGPGGFIAGDHTEPTGALGGGMCSSSTTLFNAALRAGLKMGARSNHKYYIYRYPLGLDATVSKAPGGGGQTMSFTNDMRTPIVIRSFRYRANGVGWVRYEIWGIPDGRKVSLSRPAVANRVNAVTHLDYTNDLPPGVKEQTEYPADGMDVSVTRTVRDRNGRVIHRETYYSHYQLWNGVIRIGR